MRTVTACINYIATLLEHHPVYAEKWFTLTLIDSQFYIQTRKLSPRSPFDICQFNRQDMEEGLKPEQWAYITRKIAVILAKHEEGKKLHEKNYNRTHAVSKGVK